MTRRVRQMVLSLLAVFAVVTPLTAGVVVYEKDDKKIEIGARIQIQYARTDPSVGSSSDEVFFRRLRPYIMGTVTKNWLGKVQFDFGESLDEDEVKVKDAYMQYLGWDRHKVTVGNAKSVFSREFLTSSKRQQLVERMLVGDHNFGAPDRQMGVRLDGHTEGKKISYYGTLGMEHHDPAVNRMDFDSPANTNDDWNQGYLVSARLDFHPLGFMKFDQADFHSEEWKVTAGVGAFVWSNDDDNNTYTDPITGITLPGSPPDLDSADGVEISAGTRGHGFSADVGYQKISGDTVDPTFTGGLYLNGKTDLDKFGLKGGYMFPGTTLEIVAGWQSQDADGYADKFEEKSLGLNYYLNKHDLKIQATYTMTDSFLGVPGDDPNLLQVQAQFVF